MHRHKIFLTVAAAIAVVLLGSAAFLLYRGVSGLSAAKQKLDKSRRTLKGYYEQKPFPSAANVAREEENAKVLDEWFGVLLSDLATGQIVSTEQSPTLFMKTLGERQIALMKRAKEKDAALPAEFAFGFETYFVDGAPLPWTEDVPRLTEQLLITERVIGTILEANVEAISDFTREAFEQKKKQPAATDGRGGRRGRSQRDARAPVVEAGRDVGKIGEKELYANYRFAVSLKATEAALLDVLNRLAAMDLFVVVTSVNISKVEEDVLPIAPKGAEGEDGAASTRQTYKRERLVSGPQLEKAMTVELGLAVYKFRGE